MKRKRRRRRRKKKTENDNQRTKQFTPMTNCFSSTTNINSTSATTTRNRATGTIITTSTSAPNALHVTWVIPTLTCTILSMSARASGLMPQFPVSEPETDESPLPTPEDPADDAEEDEDERFLPPAYQPLL